MSKETKKVESDKNPNGENFDAKEMLLEHGKAETKIKYADRTEIKLLKDTTYQKAGKIYSPHKIKADALVKAGIAEYVK